MCVCSRDVVARALFVGSSLVGGALGPVEPQGCSIIDGRWSGLTESAAASAASALMAAAATTSPFRIHLSYRRGIFRCSDFSM